MLQNCCPILHEQSDGILGLICIASLVGVPRMLVDIQYINGRLTVNTHMKYSTWNENLALNLKTRILG